MDVITIESKAFKELKADIKRIAEFVTKVEMNSEDKPQEIWFNSKELSKHLGICTRTLQRFRKEGYLNYTMFRGKCLYKKEDIETFLISRVVTGKIATLEEFRKRCLGYDTE